MVLFMHHGSRGESEPPRAGKAQPLIRDSAPVYGLWGLVPINTVVLVRFGALSRFLLGYQLLSSRSFLLGLIESFGWDWYVTLIFGPLYSYFVPRFSPAHG